MKNKDRKILSGNDSKEEVISLASKILKILYYVMIVGIVFLIIAVCKQLNIFDFILKLLSIMAPFFIGFIIAWIFSPLVDKLSKKGMSRIISSIIVYLIFILVFYLFMRMLIPAVYNQMNDLIKIVPKVFLSIKDFIINFFERFNDVRGFDVAATQTNIISLLEKVATSVTTSLPETIISLISAIFSGLGTFLVSLIIGFYMLFNFNNTSEQLLSLIPKRYRYEARTLTNEISFQLRKYVNGVLICAGIICVFCTLGFIIVGLPSPLLFGLFCGLTNVIPYIGPYIGGAPAVLVGFSQSPTMGILTLLVVVIVQLIEGNLINPIIMSKTMKLHPVTIIVGLLVFGAFFGVWGMILATPIIAFCKIIINFLISKYDLFDYDAEPTEIINIEPIKKKAK